MFVVFIGSILTTALGVAALTGATRRGGEPGSSLAIAAVAVVHGAVRQFRGSGGRRARQGAGGGVARDPARRAGAKKLIGRSARAGSDRVPASALRQGDIVFVEAERDRYRPMARSSRASPRWTRARSRVSRLRSCASRRRLLVRHGGTRVLSDWLVVRVTGNPGETFLDRMIAMVEGASRQSTPNEIALSILLAVLTLDLPVRDGDAGAVLGVRRRERRARARGHRSRCWSHCWSA